VDEARKVLVIGASGFVGHRLAEQLLAARYEVRCAVRTPGRVEDLAAAGCEVVRADMLEPASIERALRAVDAAYLSVHTLGPQPASSDGSGFMAAEMAGVRNVVAGCQAQGVSRLVYVTSSSVAADAPGAWLQGRWKTEQLVLNSGLDATVIGPGMIVGSGGRGFAGIVAGAKKRLSVSFGGRRRRLRTIAIDDLTYYLVGVLDEPRAFGQRFDVGSDDVLTNGEMTDVAAEVLGRPHPLKVSIPPAVLRRFAGRIERRRGLPEGSFAAYLDSAAVDLSGDPSAIRAILPRPPLGYRESVERALGRS
jgi:uncharacterized protein YbjT (DUF2867 family)